MPKFAILLMLLASPVAAASEQEFSMLSMKLREYGIKAETSELKRLTLSQRTDLETLLNSPDKGTRRRAQAILDNAGE